jgi:hypothetical protein
VPNLSVSNFFFLLEKQEPKTYQGQCQWRPRKPRQTWCLSKKKKDIEVLDVEQALKGKKKG